MTFLLIIFAVFFSLGVYLIVADILKLPTLRVSKAVLNAGRLGKKKIKTFDAFIYKLSLKLSKLIHFDGYKKRKVAATLKSAGINLTPETFVATAWIKTGLILLAVFPALLIFPLLTPVILFLAIAVYFKEIRRADDMLKKKREAVESELPRFVLTIEQELKSNRDVLSILETYKRNAGEALKHELEITVADMKSGSFEAALSRFEARVGSGMLSDALRGLISVLRGDDGIVYFQMLAHDFKLIEFQKLKLEAMKRPSKVRKYSFLMLACFVFTYLIIMGMEIIKTLGGMF